MNTIQFPNFLENLSSEFVPVVSSEFSKEDYIAIDLSENNKELDKIDVSSSEAFEGYIESYLVKSRAKVAYGGYNETREIYRRSTHFNQQNPETERNIHLGLDIWCEAGTEILAPLDGIVHSFKNNTNYGDYGPTIILEHTIQDITFYTLYGHLSTASLSSIKVGQKVVKGQVIAALGSAEVNGDYAPHLHFQIIKDMQGNTGDYPGVANKKRLIYYLDNCPNPNLLLKIAT
ncbi:peptidoglycan DD-metalloendopeptidase family protein [Aquimarina sp. MMG016]|uniref:peptidoglycan DD-metalloendopeptidase family protein n=1 Tax=Aquimarina sp. MMG016 TaxID=2822690 RepID=UPI001B3A5F27|nr:peptidoglycan DD-metalloendopeptidase family protein [Aquimarina sp. MMG016]MBQ4820332.1 peptidoglycan DD-metalloendopeptidase family protein [Aquimarina sp. MMG016]